MKVTIGIRSVAILILFSLLTMHCDTQLDIENHNEPDRKRVLSSDRMAEEYLGSAFYQSWRTVSGACIHNVHLASCIADEMTTSWCVSNAVSREPRIPWDNSPSYAYQHDLENFWNRPYESLSVVNDILMEINEGRRFVDETGMDQTIRNQVFCIFIQGISLGWLGLVFDRAVIVDEHTELTPDLEPAAFEEVIQVAMEKLAQCLNLCDMYEFEIPEYWWPGNQFDQDRLARLGHTYAARILASSARSPEERDRADWASIRSHLEQGITEDFGIECDGENWWSNLHGLASNSTFCRTDYKLIGPADTSGAYAAWLASPVELRHEFDIHTDDRRITGATPTEAGLYFAYYGRSPFRLDRGTYHFSRYHVTKFLSYYEAGYRGFAPILSVAEKNFLLAEAELRLGNPQAAADLINLTRVENGGLPPATADVIGDPADERSPRGSLWAMLKYEKGIETLQLQMGVAWFDRRGWGTLVPGTVLHYPIPGRELELMGMPIYTFGGVGGEGAAPGG